MQNAFNNKAALSEAEQTLDNLRVKYRKLRDGTLIVADSVDLSRRQLTQLPDLSSVVVEGGFYCSDNLLTSLRGAPKSVGRSFFCNRNRLTSLEGAPGSVSGSFACDDNLLTSLTHAPHTVGEDFSCTGNLLASLEDAPQTFVKLLSDFGQFISWSAVPGELQLSPESQAKLATVLQSPLPVSKPLAFRK